MAILQTINLTKKFKSLTAVDSVSINIEEGEIFGLLGPNGAGKTTLISMLVTMKKPTSGSAIVNGFNIQNSPSEVRKSIGIVFQDQSLDEELTAYENLELHAATYGLPKAERNKRINEVIGIVELSDRLNSLVKTFSGGMKRRLEIGRGLLHYPRILFLDEPTIGLDPQTRNHIWEYIKKLKKEHGITIILTTHYMEEADAICDRIGIIDHGKIVALDNSVNLKNSMGGDTIKLESESLIKLEDILKKFEWVKQMRIEGISLIITLETGEKKIPEIIEIAAKHKIDIKSVTMHKPSLEEVFLKYTGHSIREEEANTKDSMRTVRKIWGRK